MTGDIAFRFLNHVRNKSPRGRLKTETDDSHVTVCDINRAMLDVGQQRARRFNYSSGTSWWNVFVIYFADSKRMPLIVSP